MPIALVLHAEGMGMLTPSTVRPACCRLGGVAVVATLAAACAEDEGRGRRGCRCDLDALALVDVG